MQTNRESQSGTFAVPGSTISSGHTGSFLGVGLRIKGEISGHEDLMLDSTVEGLVSVGGFRLTVGPAARLKGNIVAREAIVSGEVKGHQRRRPNRNQEKRHDRGRSIHRQDHHRRRGLLFRKRRGWQANYADRNGFGYPAQERQADWAKIKGGKLIHVLPTCKSSCDRSTCKPLNKLGRLSLFCHSIYGERNDKIF
jgi:hypothetical protein